MRFIDDAKMNILKKFGLVGLLVQTAGLMAFATNAMAIPIDGTVLDASSGYSVVHGGSNAGSAGNSAYWLWFDSGQSLSFDLTAGTIPLSGNQLFSLTSQNGGTGSIELTGLDLDLNDVTGGSASGTLDYILDGSQIETFNFSNDNYGSSLFNSSSFGGTNLQLYIWGW
jgi:hypothetical protein